PCRTATTHVLVFVAAVAISGHGGDDPGHRVHFTHPMIHRVGQIEIVLRIEHHGFRRMEHRARCRLVVPVVAIPADAGERGDDAAGVVDLPDPIATLVHDHDVALAVHRDADDVVQARFYRGFSVVQIHRHVQTI